MTDYDDAPIPPDETPTTTTDPVCQECGVPLVYGGRGRKPKWCDEHKPKRTSGTTGRRTSGDVTQALAILDGMYRGFTMALMVVSPRAAGEWTARIPDLMATNTVILTGDRDLTRSICKMGQGGGKIAFAGAHVMALAPVGLIVRAELADRRAIRDMQRATQEADTQRGQSGQPFENAGFFE